MVTDVSVEYPPVEEIIGINRHITLLYSEQHSVDNGSRLAEILAAVRVLEHGVTQRERVAAKAAMLAFRIAGNQLFFEGNKRTAYIVSSGFLEENGYRLTARFEQTYALLDKVARRIERDFETVLSFFLMNVR